MTDIDNFDAFMRTYQDMVYSAAVRLLGNEADAEDVSQEVFLKAYERFEEVSPSSTAGGWLKTVTRNICLNHLSRYRARWRFFSELTSDEDGPSEFECAVPANQEKEIAMADRRRLLEEALHKLPAAQRVPLVLYHFEDMSYEDIAARLKTSLGKVKTDIFRGREALRKKLKLDSDGDLAGTVGAAPARASLSHPNRLLAFI
jgi:RNA polymerase sigma-70 factor (ECF subfamily)